MGIMEIIELKEKIMLTMIKITSMSSTRTSTRTNIKSSTEAGVGPEVEEEEARTEEIEGQEEDSTQEEEDMVDFEETARRKTLGKKEVPRNLLQAVEGAIRWR